MGQQTSGGSLVAGKLQELEKALEEYYGARNELKEGIANISLDKPEALLKLEQCEMLGLPLVRGGLMDQPHIWLLEVGVVKNVREKFELLETLQQDQDGGQ